jgi:hypothetical protein
LLSLPKADESVFLYSPLGVVILHELAYITTDLLESSIEPLHNPDGLGRSTKAKQGLIPQNLT